MDAGNTLRTLTRHAPGSILARLYIEQRLSWRTAKKFFRLAPGRRAPRYASFFTCDEVSGQAGNIVELRCI